MIEAHVLRDMPYKLPQFLYMIAADAACTQILLLPIFQCLGFEGFQEPGVLRQQAASACCPAGM